MGTFEVKKTKKGIYMLCLLQLALSVSPHPETIAAREKRKTIANWYKSDRFYVEEKGIHIL